MTRSSRDDLPLEWIEEDSAPASSPRRRRPYPLLVAAAAGLLVGVVAVLPKGRPAISPTPTAVPATTTVTPLAVPVEVSRAGRPLMAVPSSWELIGRGAELVRIELGAGRVTRTAIPAVQSTGPVYLVAGLDRVVIRPLDFVPGYLVPDGHPAQPLTGLLGNGGPAFPGPDSQHLWVDVDTSGGRQMELVGFDGSPTGRFTPSIDTFPEAPDGTGYLLFSNDRGTYLARPGGSDLVTTGRLLAAGPTRWLAQQCAGGACQVVVTDRATGRARPLATRGLANVPPLFPGTIAPDGAMAALAEGPGPVLHLVDLATGHDRPIGRLPPFGNWDAMVWSPDSRALFFVDDVGALQVVDLAAMRANGLGIALPPMYQLAFRVKSVP